MDEVFSLKEQDTPSSPSRGNSTSYDRDSSMRKTADFKSFRQINVVNTPGDQSSNSGNYRPIIQKN